jgi:hypothetical protein
MLKTLASFFFPMAVGLSPAVPASINQFLQAQSIEDNGGLLNNGGLVAALQAFANNAAPNAGSVNYATSSAASATLTNLAGLNQLFTNGGAVTVTLDNAPNVVSQIPGAFNGMTFPVRISCIAATSVAAPTVTNTGITLSGTTTVSANSYRDYRGTITQLFSNTVQALTAGTTFTSITQISSTNLYTLALGTNAITTTVGSLIYLAVTAGTLPPGWYPIYSAGTTSVVIALPPSGTAWTATAVSTMVQPTTAPLTYAPLITLTGMYMVTGTIVA